MFTWDVFIHPTKYHDMSFLEIHNVKIKGISACVPSRVEETKDYSLMTEEEIQKYISSTGVIRKHRVKETQCTSDLCFVAAEKLISDLGWDKSEIGLLVFVSHTGDYKLPSTSCTLQQRLGIPTSCMAFDINHGCSGYLYGLSIIGNLLSAGTIKKGLLLVGNTQSKNVSFFDQSTYLIFGDAGSVTALEYAPENYDLMDFHFFTDGSEFESVYIPDGGYRHPITPSSFVMEEFGNGIKRNRTHLRMEGADVYSYANSYIPKSVQALIEHCNMDVATIDYLVMHQANKFLCERIRKKIKIPEEKTPYTFPDFGNTSGASIPLTMVLKLKEQLRVRDLDLLMATIGGGFSIASARLKTRGDIYCPELLILD